MKKVYRDHSLGYKENEEFKKSARPKTSPTPSVQGNNMTDDEETPDPEPQPQRNTEAPPPKRPANQPRGESLFEQISSNASTLCSEGFSANDMQERR